MMLPSTLPLSIVAILEIIGTSSAFVAPRSNSPVGPGRRCSRRHRRPSSLSPASPRKSQDESSTKNEEEEECLLVPQANPNSDPNATSLSKVSYSAVISGIDALYPPTELSNRNAKSRTDGYWKYVERGERPPREFTYGEFDIDFFGALLDRSWEHYTEGRLLGEEDDDDTATNKSEDDTNGDEDSAQPWEGRTFCDIGSGAGRLVLSAAALHPEWKLCRGLEILEGLHNLSETILSGCLPNDGEGAQRRPVLRIPRNETTTSCETESDGNQLPLAPIHFTHGSFTDPYEYLGDIDCAFVFSSCMKPALVQELSLAIGRQCRPGTIIVTTEFPLFVRGTIDPLEGDESSMPHGPYEIQLLEKIEGWCWLLGGASTAYVHRVTTSLWEEYAGPRRAPQLSLEEEAFRLVRLIESGDLTDTDEFLRNVRNDMIFHGVNDLLGIGNDER